MITGVRPETFTNLQLNAGAFLKDFNYSSYSNAAALRTAVVSAIKAGTNVLGATRGGGTFQATPNMRQIEADGKRYEFKGSEVNDSWDISMTGTMLEVNPENFKAALALADIVPTESSAKKHVLKLRTDIKDSDYINHLIWVGDTSKGLMLIDLENALNTTGANFTFTDKGEGTIPFKFNAHQDDVGDYEEAPVTIVFFDD